ncbi:hypothetical protein LX24_01499 [Desulfallas thermosapovorans DSM 6562]|uniref:Flagellar Assembly Protein A N-terminal region domain-containing protein n=1 Tax=Desulfallas thermosapovorans DSM 6562 TaxID=1121431 RepID=A0A5S4ZSB3_9FIRM|nr:FapA family protein [Desulfallas thermosapovorans]TYO95538.1 hypothetical protein LX24_01499 [Desulfallas thermosapovorans DSM 6562]
MSDVGNGVILIITDDKMKAFFTVREPQLVNEKLIYDMLQEKEVKHGLDKRVLEHLINNPAEGTYLIANGTPPREGRDGYVQYLFTSQTPRANKQDEQNVDFREVFDVPSVNAGTVLAVYHPAEKGENGQTVTGQVITPRKVMELRLQAGKGAVLSKDGMTVSSAINGRPRVQKRGGNIIVSVDAVYQHEGDVDIKSGNLRFNGDVIVTGNVMENMIVDVQGNLQVLGFISRAEVKVQKNLQVMKVITASRIQVGGKTASLGAAKKELQEIAKTINLLNKTAKQAYIRLQQTRRNIQFGQVVMTLLDKKFAHLGGQVRHLRELIGKREQNAPQELKDVLVDLKKVSGFNALALHNLDGVQKSIAKALAYLDSLSGEPAHVIANSVTSSQIEATGDIKITGQGAFNSQLNCQGAITIKGVFRGGQMYALNGINAGEIGGPMGVTTLARTETGCTIKARRAYTGTVLQIGHRIYKVTRDVNMLLARINSEGDIVLH